MSAVIATGGVLWEGTVVSQGKVSPSKITLVERLVATLKLTRTTTLFPGNPQRLE